MSATSAGTPAPTRPPLAQGIDVVRCFGDVVAVDHAAIEVHRGEVVGLLGANGAGKTTLIRALLGLIRVTSGEVRLFDLPPSRSSRREVGYLPQGLGLYEELSVEENLEFAAGAFGVPLPSLQGDLEAEKGHAVGSLSLGVQRRVAFARALAHGPRLLVLDEPTSGVDPLARARLWDTIRGAAEAGAGILVTTHSMEEAEQCDRLVVMASGRVVASGTRAQVVGDATAVEVRTGAWEEAFRALDEADLPIVLVGRTLRVSDAEPTRVEAVLAAVGVGAEVRTVPATLEEAFVRLSGVAE